MKKKGDGHENLSLFFKRDGVRPKMVMGGSKEKTIVSIRKEFQVADFQINQMETYYT